MAVITKNKKKLFAFNSVSGAIQLILTSLLVFVCIPVFTGKLGVKQYGIFGVMSIFGNISMLANLALDTALIKYLSEQGKSQESDYDIVTTFLLYVFIFFPLSVLVYLFRNFLLLDVLKIPSEFLSVSCTLLLCLLIANFLLLTGKVFSSILDSNHKIYLTSFYMFINSVIYWGGIIIVVLNGHGLDWVGYVICFSAVIWFLLMAFSAMKLWGKIRISGLRRNFSRIVKKQLSYSTKIYSSGLLAFLYEPLTRALVSNFLGVGLVTVYDITLRVKSNIMTLFSRLLYPAYPLIAQESDMNKLKNLVEKITKGLYYSIIPIIVILMVCTGSIMPLWLKGDNITMDMHILSVSVIILVSASLLFMTTVIPFYTFLKMKNHPEKDIYIQAVNVIVNLIIIYFTYDYLGYYSIILGNTVSSLVVYLLYVYLQKKFLNSYPLTNVRDTLKYILIFLFIGISTWLFSLLFKDQGWIDILLIASFSCIISAVTFYYLKPLPLADSFIAGKIKNLDIREKLIK